MLPAAIILFNPLKQDTASMLYILIAAWLLIPYLQKSKQFFNKAIQNLRFELNQAVAGIKFRLFETSDLLQHFLFKSDYRNSLF
jgi:hypothetical protein